MGNIGPVILYTKISISLQHFARIIYISNRNCSLFRANGEKTCIILIEKILSKIIDLNWMELDHFLIILQMIRNNDKSAPSTKDIIDQTNNVPIVFVNIGAKGDLQNIL